MAWRLLNHGPAYGAWNMGVDEAVFRSAVERAAPPTVRFYGWSRPTVSLGFRQELEKACDLEACRKHGIDVVRRFTGGRAVLHHREVTYSVAAAAEGDLRGLSVRQVYQWVSRVVRRALESNGISLDSSDAVSSRSTSSTGRLDDELPCFAAPSRHEITSGGRKLVGGAQKWSRRGFVQHGSVLVEVDRALWTKVWGTRAATTIAQAVGVSELAGERLTTLQLTEILASEFERTFGEPPSQDSLSPAEKKLAAELANSKYASAEWSTRAPLTGRLYTSGTR